MIEDMACFGKGAQAGRFDSQDVLHFFQLRSLLDGTEARQGGIKEVKEDQTKILVIMKLPGGMRILGRKFLKHGPKRFKVFESFEGILIDGIHRLISPEILSLKDRGRPL